MRDTESRNRQVKAGISLLLLFGLYHAAEYMIMFQNSATGFLVFQALFFLAAWLLGNWYSGDGLGAWGLSGQGPVYKYILVGIVGGIGLYAVPFLLSLALGIEKIIALPESETILLSTLPFAFGVLFSSFSEDILTRGVPYAHFHKAIGPVGLAVLSAFVYLFNHIYRLGDGPEAWLYLFLLGIVYIIPLLGTRRLWVTGAMHWAGNTFFFVTHSVLQTEEAGGAISANYLFSIWLAVLIPVMWYLARIRKHTSTKSPF